MLHLVSSLEQWLDWFRHNLSFGGFQPFKIGCGYGMSISD